MDSEQQLTTVPSVSMPNVRQPKMRQESTVSSSKSQTKEISSSGKSMVSKKARKGNSRVPDLRLDPHFHEKVNKLRERTKHVKSKLTNIKQAMGNSNASSTSKNIMVKQDSRELTESDILEEIERLKGLVKEMRLNSSEQSARKNSLQSNDSCKSMGKVKRRRVRIKNKKKAVDENQLEKLYEQHINRIVRGGDDKSPELDNLKFKVGDDLAFYAKKCVEAGLGCIVTASMRVNAKNNHQAFIIMTEGTDAMTSSMAVRKYAMEGDIVEAFVRNPPAELKPLVGNRMEAAIEAMDEIDVPTENHEDLCVNEIKILRETKTIPTSLTRHAFVIRVVKQLDNRVFVGSITFKAVKLDDCDYFKFKPRDTKLPMVYIPVQSCTEVLSTLKPHEIVGYLYMAKLVEIKDTGRCIGSLQAPIGKCGNLESEIKAILLHNGLKDVQPFEERFEKMWYGSARMTEEELERVEDLRNECIFTIDPLTARDLDDAVSCEFLENNCYEIGVHISDVSRFLKEKSELDELVKLRATSIYLVNEVIHMLPKSLCMKCSLLPDEDKFTMSVFWKFDKNAKVLSTRFARTVIRSCTQFAYEHAQKIIDNPDEVFNVDDFPTVHNGFSVADVVERIKHLHLLADMLRTKRFENGSLSIDKPQIYFRFDPASGEPTGYDVASRLTANFLIEEFMLLANEYVAKFIYVRFPNLSFLRKHEPPKMTAIKNLKAKLFAAGIELDMSCSRSIFKGLERICGGSNTPQDISAAMNYLLTKPMMRAKYFCSENVSEPADLHHYALAIPIYTHFTSPIRRYPDILVHRLLCAALEYTEPPTRTPDELHDLARICNEQKFNAKSAGEDSSNLYFQRFVKASKSIILRAVVTDIYRHSMEVIVLETGHLIPIQFKIQKVIVDASKSPTAIYISEKHSRKQPMEIRMFTALEIKLSMWEGKLSGFFITPDIEQRIKNDIALKKKPEPTGKKWTKEK